MSRPVSRKPYLLLGAMTAATLGGPIGFGRALRGGASPHWPPDRPVEWAALLGTSSLVLALMMACLSLALVNRKALPPPPSGPAEGRP